MLLFHINLLLSKMITVIIIVQGVVFYTPCTRMPAHWHTWTRPQGAQPLTYAPAGAYVSMHGFTPAARRIHVWREPYVSAYCSGRDAGEHNADERRFIKPLSAFINRDFGLRSVGVCFAYPSFDKTFIKFCVHPRFICFMRYIEKTNPIRLKKA